MIGINVAEFNMIGCDFVDLFNSPESTDIVLSWETGTPDTRYPGKWVGSPVAHQQSFRGIIVFALGVGRMKPETSLDKRRFANMPDADIAIIMPASINLKGLVNSKFTVTGLGEYHVIEKPAEDISQYGIMFMSQNAFVQFVECKASK